MKNKILFCFILIIIFFTSILLFTNKANAQENSKYQFVLEKQIKLQKNHKGIYINDSLHLSYSSTMINIFTHKGELKIVDQYQDYYYDKENLYICSNKCLYIINIDLLSYKQVMLDMHIYSICVDDYIFVVGNINDNPCIYLLNQSGEMVKTNIYEGDGYATFKSIDKVEDNYLVTGEKDAFFENPDFLKVGNQNDIKSFMFVFDKTLRKINDYFFNEYSQVENLTSIEVDESINVILKNEVEEVIYKFDYNLNLLNRIIMDSQNNHYFIPNILNEVLLIQDSQNSFDILLLDDNNFVSILNIPYKLISFNMTYGGIAINYNDEIKLYSEYHINSLNELVLTKLSYDYESTKHFDVKSFFENLTFELDHYTPFHMHMMSGNYIATYIAKNTFGNEIYIQTDVVVKDFVNIINNGVYNTNTMLQFFGDATLNGKTVVNGHIIQNPGTYELVIKNVNGIMSTYVFEVVDNYYKDNDNYVIDVDYILNIDEELILDFDVINLLDVEYLVINNERYYDFDIIDNHLYLCIKSLDGFGYQNIYINYLVSNSEVIEINKELSVMTKKKAPSLNISSSVSNSQYQIYIDYEDKDNTLVDLYYKNDLEKVSTYMKDNSGVENTGSIVLAYELGDGKILEQTLVSIEGRNIDYDISFIEGRIQININTNSSLKSIMVGNQNIYQDNTDNINLYIIIFTIITSFLLVVITSILLIIKRKRRKANLI